MDSFERKIMRKNIKTVMMLLIPIIVLAAIVFIFSSFTIVHTGYTGVSVKFGQVSDEIIPSGFNFKTPIVEKIVKVNNKINDINIQGQIWSESSERTALFFENVVVTNSINPEKSAWIVANISNYENIITFDIVSSALKSASKTLNSTDVTNRSKIEPLAMEYLQNILNEKFGEGTIIIHRITISNIDFEESYNEAIANKQKAQLEYEKQQIENKKAVEKAEADAEVRLKNAKAEAEAKLISAKAEAEANKKIASSLTESIIKKNFYDKWNGELPKVQGGTSIIEFPFDNLK